MILNRRKFSSFFFTEILYIPSRLKLTITFNYLENVDQTPDLQVILSTAFTIEEERILDAPVKTLKALNLNYKVRTPDFGNVSPHGKSYSDAFDSNDVYYFIASDKYITYATSYTFDSTTGKYTLVNPQVGRYGSIYSSLTNKYVANKDRKPTNSLDNYENLDRIYKMVPVINLSFKTASHLTGTGSPDDISIIRKLKYPFVVK